MNRSRQYTGWIVLAAYSLLLITALGRNGSTDNVPLWSLQDSQKLIAWIGDLAAKGFFEFVYFVPIGFIAAMIAGSSPQHRQSGLRLPALALACTVTILVKSFEIGRSWHLATVVGLILPVMGCLFGTWMGTTWLRGPRARLWFLPKVVILALLAVFCAGTVIKLSVQDRPLPFEAARVSSADKRRLAYLFRSKNPKSLIEGQTHILRLTEDDINVLFSWGLSLGSPSRKARIDLGCDSASLAVSINTIPDGRKKQYLNLTVSGVPAVEEGILSLKINQLRLGVLEVPGWLLKMLSPVVISILHHDQRSKPFLDATQALVIGQDFMEVTYGPLDLSYTGFREDLFGQAKTGEDVLISTRAQVENLLAVVSRSPDTKPDFGECFETVFSLARDRSVNGDPVIENKAGIFALGILLGHPRVEEFLGPVHAGRDQYAARRALSDVKLRGRPDWTKHFCVGAAIALLSEDVISYAASLLKEEIDADIAGSGFSFSDMLAAQCGTRFAIQATHDETSARAMQESIISGFRVEAYFPPADDLPEGITDAELQSRYGGVGGEGYNRLIEEIERRISFCAGYHELK